MSPGRLACAAALALVAWGPVPAVWAQPARDASLRVTVRDTSEAVIVGAAVTLSREGVAPVTVVTNERGEALFDGLQVASWTVRASSPGFDAYSPPNSPNKLSQGCGQHMGCRMAT